MILIHSENRTIIPTRPNAWGDDVLSFPDYLSGAAGAADMVCGEGVGVVAEVVRAAAVQKRFDDVEAVGYGRESCFAQVLMGCAHQIPALFPADRRRRAGAADAVPGLDLDEAEDAAVTGDEVEFAVGAAAIPGEEVKACP